jgi:hypothetical protein
MKRPKDLTDAEIMQRLGAVYRHRNRAGARQPVTRTEEGQAMSTNAEANATHSNGQPPSTGAAEMPPTACPAEAAPDARQTPLGDGAPESDKPADTAGNGRDARGQFVQGNKCSPGNPFGRKLAELRSALINAVTAEDMRAIAEGLVQKAKMGFPHAIKVVLLYCVGRPTEPVNPDRVALDEWKLLDAHPSRFELWRALFDSVPPELAAALLHSWLPPTLEDAKAGGRMVLGNGEGGEIVAERTRRRRKG